MEGNIFHHVPTGWQRRQSLRQHSTLSEGKSYALHNVVELDGRVGAYPLSARGCSPINCYVLREPDGALLIDTGFAAHERSAMMQLEAVLEPDLPIALFPSRLNEFMSVGNATAIAKRFNVTACYSSIQDVSMFLDFTSLTPTEMQEVSFRLPTALMAGSEWRYIGSGRKDPSSSTRRRYA